MKKCREYVCAKSDKAQEKPGYSCNEDNKYSPNKNRKEFSEQWEYKEAFDQKDYLSVINLSGGKDSTCLLILMIEKGLPIDAVLNADTGMEFPEMYEHLEKVDKYLYKERGLHITTLRHSKGFEWLMFEEQKKRPSSIQNRIKLGVPCYGNGWPGIKVRWCTGQLKIKPIEKEIQWLKNEKEVLRYIGIAADETQRCKGEQYPLVEWGITEAKALQICYDHGFDFGGLYKKYHRASCWCCPLQRISELQNLRKYHPQLWKRLMEMDQRAREQFGSNALGQFKQRWSVEGLENRFAKEEKVRLNLP